MYSKFKVINENFVMTLKKKLKIFFSKLRERDMLKAFPVRLYEISFFVRVFFFGLREFEIYIMAAESVKIEFQVGDYVRIQLFSVATRSLRFDLVVSNFIVCIWVLFMSLRTEIKTKVSRDDFLQI